uniref:VIER F-box protein 2 n=1 Tax=Tanacetum cinerariifolium TaxID=118510 RepID=A0A6L2JDL3_TANCI|nr:VIER F-box protein 2 [Tanacetum cinerariifolium]
MMKVTKVESEGLGLPKNNDDLFTYDTPLGTDFNEFNQLIRMDDNLFTYEVEIHGLFVFHVPCNWCVIWIDQSTVANMEKENMITTWLVRSYKNQFKEYKEIKRQWEVYRLYTNVLRDPYNTEYSIWLALKFFYHMTMDWYTKNTIWLYWKRGDDEVVLTDEDISDLVDETLIDENENFEIFKIKTEIFSFETPPCKASNELNYLLKVDTDLFTHDIPGFKTYKEYKNEWIYEWNRGIPWIPKEP